VVKFGKEIIGALIGDLDTLINLQKKIGKKAGLSRCGFIIKPACHVF
jgi:hypothetical protein